MPNVWNFSRIWGYIEKYRMRFVEEEEDMVRRGKGFCGVFFVLKVMIVLMMIMMMMMMMMMMMTLI